MKATELRIGNLFYKDYPTGKEIETVNEISNFFINSVGISSIKPIPLTKDWLLKFGFDGCKSPNKDIQVGLVDDEMSLAWRVFILKKIQYVHQLQNLYFALTGEELTLKNK